MTPSAPSSYVGYRFPAEIISFAVWLYFRFPLSLRHVDEILAARGIVVSHETVPAWCMDPECGRNRPSPIWCQAIRA
jgi:putative transposase